MRMRMRRSRLATSAPFIALPLTLALLVALGCSDNDLRKVADALNITAKGVGELQTAVIEAEARDLMTTETTRTVLQLCTKINLAGKDATAITRSLAKLAPENRRNLLSILRPVIAAVDSAVSTGLAGIKNDETRQKIRGLLLAIQSSLNTAQIALAAR